MGVQLVCAESMHQLCCLHTTEVMSISKSAATMLVHGYTQLTTAKEVNMVCRLQHMAIGSYVEGVLPKTVQQQQPTELV